MKLSKNLKVHAYEILWLQNVCVCAFLEAHLMGNSNHFFRTQLVASFSGLLYGREGKASYTLNAHVHN